MSLAWEFGYCDWKMVTNDMRVRLTMHFWDRLSLFSPFIDAVPVETIPGKSTSSQIKWSLTWILVSFYLTEKGQNDFDSMMEHMVWSSRGHSNQIELSGPGGAQGLVCLLFGCLPQNLCELLPVPVSASIPSCCPSWPCSFTLVPWASFREPICDSTHLLKTTLCPFCVFMSFKYCIVSSLSAMLCSPYSSLEYHVISESNNWFALFTL